MNWLYGHIYAPRQLDQLRTLLSSPLGSVVQHPPEVLHGLYTVIKWAKNNLIRGGHFEWTYCSEKISSHRTSSKHIFIQAVMFDVRKLLGRLVPVLLVPVRRWESQTLYLLNPGITKNTFVLTLFFLLKGGYP